MFVDVWFVGARAVSSAGLRRVGGASGSACQHVGPSRTHNELSLVAWVRRRVAGLNLLSITSEWTCSLTALRALQVPAQCSMTYMYTFIDRFNLIHGRSIKR